MTARRCAALLATTVLAAALAACAPASAPTPTPTPTGFASEEEAFAAAEATYRAYVDALNRVDLSDPATFEPVYSLLDGEALASEKKTLTQMHADGWRVSGETEVPSISAGEMPAQILVCQDVSGVAVVDAAGQSRVSPDRPDIFALDVEIEQDPTSVTGARIVASTAIEDDRC
ncbi:hypothetical protein [Microbacterium oleivorans]|uniref:hypothetical protein n=1 Tax=Microbacterium oleivorans TaxID=273677 RepID=UPI002040BB27|nr:hypothetical protein [Microbacterium oleivorans]MCM3696431.1 hypothetical protein [Microbacterium oleivorans]